MGDGKHLFTPLSIQSIEFHNRIWVSPMCQYSSVNGYPTDWHFVHLGSRAVGGAGLVMVEATAVSPEGRISPDDSGIWTDEHIASFKRLSDFIQAEGAVSGIQIAHAGRKASVCPPWLPAKVLSDREGGWEAIAPSPIAFESHNKAPHAMSKTDIEQVILQFELAAERCLKAGFQVLEIHMAHGYLMHEFLSPISNQRQDNYGGSLENRMRFPLEVARAVRSRWPADLPLFVRISATDWADETMDSWKLVDTIVLCEQLKRIGVDLIDCSSGGTLPNAVIPTEPGYQVPFAEAIKQDVKIMTAAVGMITCAEQAEAILCNKQADAVFMGREFLRNPYWPMHAAQKLGCKISKPKQYSRS